MFKNYLSKLENAKSVEVELENETNNNNDGEIKVRTGKKRTVMARLRYKSIASDLVDFLIRYRQWWVVIYN